MGKRAAQSSTGKEAKVAKVAKVEVDPFTQELAPLLQHLEKAELNPTSVEMLQSVAPHCLKTSQESRHAFQNSMVDALGSALQSIHTKQEATLAEAQKGLEDLVARQEQHTEQLKGVEATVEESRVAHEAKVQVENAVEAEAAEASQRLAEAKENVEALGREKTAVLKEQEGFEKFMVSFEALKNGTYAGKEWRERNRAIDETLKMLSDVCDVSLRAALPTALRTKPADRKRFSLKALNFCELSLASRGSKLKEALGGFESRAADRAAAAEATQQGLEAVQGRLLEARAEAKGAKELWGQGQKQKKELEKEIKGAPAALERATRGVEQVKGELAHSEAIVAKFQELKARQAEVAKEETPAA